MSAVRRASAILLMVLIGFSLIGPAFSADTESSLPACCRRAGQHHCATGMGSSESSGPAFQTESHCPLFPGSLVVLAGSGDLLAVVFSAMGVLLFFETAVLGSPAASHPVFGGFSHQKRGPPCLIPSF
jgi:hypothetical protein